MDWKTPRIMTVAAANKSGLLPVNLSRNVTPSLNRRQVERRPSTQVDGRRRDSVKMIEPSLMDASMSTPASTSTATRPPVIGREFPLDPERSQRYSSSDTQLQEYLETLRRKSVDATITTAENAPEFVKLSDNVSRFLKKAPAVTSVNKPGADQTPKYLLAPQTLSTASTALQRAQLITSKFATISKKPTKDPPDASNRLEEPVESIVSEESSSRSHAVSQVAVEGESDDGHLSRVGSFLNIRDLDELLSDMQSEQQLVISKEESKSPSKVSSTEPLHLLESDRLESSSSHRNEKSVEESIVERTIASEVAEERLESGTRSEDSKMTETQSTSSSSSAAYSYDFEEEETVTPPNDTVMSPNGTSTGTRSLMRQQPQTSSTEETDHVRVTKKREKVRRRSPTSSRVLTASKKVQTEAMSLELGLVADPIPLYSVPPPSRLPPVSFVDPPRISTHIINNDALRTLSSYMPARIALDELLTQQLRITRSFVESQRRIYTSVVDSLRPDHEYTTWTGTKQLISYQRSRRKATVS